MNGARSYYYSYSTTQIWDPEKMVASRARWPEDSDTTVAIVV